MGAYDILTVNLIGNFCWFRPSSRLVVQFCNKVWPCPSPV